MSTDGKLINPFRQLGRFGVWKYDFKHVKNTLGGNWEIYFQHISVCNIDVYFLFNAKEISSIDVINVHTT
jgi:hypothetical protein